MLGNTQPWVDILAPAQFLLPSGKYKLLLSRKHTPQLREAQFPQPIGNCFAGSLVILRHDDYSCPSLPWILHPRYRRSRGRLCCCLVMPWNYHSCSGGKSVCLLSGRKYALREGKGNERKLFICQVSWLRAIAGLYLERMPFFYGLFVVYCYYVAITTTVEP